MAAGVQLGYRVKREVAERFKEFIEVSMEDPGYWLERLLERFVAERVAFARYRVVRGAEGLFPGELEREARIAQLRLDREVVRSMVAEGRLPGWIMEGLEEYERRYGGGGGPGS